MYGSHLLVIILLAISSNLDNVGIAAAYGTRKVAIPFNSNVLIAIVTGIGTLLSIMVGKGIYWILKPGLANFIGASIIIGAGIWVTVQETIFRSRNSSDDEQCKAVGADADSKPLLTKVLMILNNPFVADRDFSGSIDIREGFLLGLALTLNNIPNGVGAGMIGLSPALTTSFVFVFSIMTIWIGIKAGHYFGSHLFGRLAGPVSGLLLIAVGVYEIFS